MVAVKAETYFFFSCSSEMFKNVILSIYKNVATFFVTPKNLLRAIIILSWRFHFWRLFPSIYLETFFSLSKLIFERFEKRSFGAKRNKLKKITLKSTNNKQKQQLVSQLCPTGLWTYIVILFNHHTIIFELVACFKNNYFNFWHALSSVLFQVKTFITFWQRGKFIDGIENGFVILLIGI